MRNVNNLRWEIDNVYTVCVLDSNPCIRFLKIFPSIVLHSCVFYKFSVREIRKIGHVGGSQHLNNELIEKRRKKMSH